MFRTTRWDRYSPAIGAHRQKHPFVGEDDRLVQRTADALDSLWKEAELEASVSRLAPVSG